MLYLQENGGTEDADQYADLFDDDDDMMLQASANAVEGGGEGLAKNPLMDSDDEDDGVPTLHKRQKALKIIDDDENSRGLQF